MNKYKRGQSEIITTVLIILLVLAAVVIVWQVVRTTVQKGAEQVPGQTDCMTVDVTIASAIEDGDTTHNNIILERGTGAGTLAGVKIYDNDVYMGEISTPGLTELMTKSYQPLKGNITAGHNIKIAKVIGSDMANGRLCDFTDDGITAS